MSNMKKALLASPFVTAAVLALSPVPASAQDMGSNWDPNCGCNVPPAQPQQQPAATANNNQGQGQTAYGGNVGVGDNSFNPTATATGGAANSDAIARANAHANNNTAVTAKQNTNVSTDVNNTATGGAATGGSVSGVRASTGPVNATGGSTGAIANINTAQAGSGGNVSINASRSVAGAYAGTPNGAYGICADVGRGAGAQFLVFGGSVTGSVHTNQECLKAYQEGQARIEAIHARANVTIRIVGAFDIDCDTKEAAVLLNSGLYDTAEEARAAAHTQCHPAQSEPPVVTSPAPAMKSFVPPEPVAKQLKPVVLKHTAG